MQITSVRRLVVSIGLVASIVVGHAAVGRRAAACGGYGLEAEVLRAIADYPDKPLPVEKLRAQGQEALAELMLLRQRMQRQRESALKQPGVVTCVISNQSGIARGYLTEADLRAVHDHLVQYLTAEGAKLDAIYYCPHHPSVGQPPYLQDCNCRKPKPGMLLRAADEFQIDLKRSYVIGDRYGDIELAHNAGTKSILVLSGYGRGEYEYQRNHSSIQPDWVAKNLLEATEIISQQVG